jgi:hypothetical protein
MLARRLTEEAVRFIATRRDRPLLLYVADVAAQHPDVVRRLAGEAENHRARVPTVKPLFDTLLSAPPRH